MDNFEIISVATEHDHYYDQDSVIVVIGETVGPSCTIKHKFKFRVEQYQTNQLGETLISLKPSCKSQSFLPTIEYKIQTGYRGAVDMDFMYNELLKKFKHDVLEVVMIKLGSRMHENVDTLTTI